MVYIGKVKHRVRVVQFYCPFKKFDTLFDIFFDPIGTFFLNIKKNM